MVSQRSCVRVCVCVLITQLCLTLCDPMDCSPPGSSVYGILQARILDRVDIPFSDLPDPGIEPGLLHCRQILCHLSHLTLKDHNEKCFPIAEGKAGHATETCHPQED